MGHNSFVKSNFSCGEYSLMQKYVTTIFQSLYEHIFFIRCIIIPFCIPFEKKRKIKDLLTSSLHLGSFLESLLYDYIHSMPLLDFQQLHLYLLVETIRTKVYKLVYISLSSFLSIPLNNVFQFPIYGIKILNLHQY